MSASSKFDLSSGSPDRPSYNAGQRASYTAASLDRSSSFRENIENPILSSLPNMTRSSSVVAQADVTNYFQCIRFDPKSMVSDHKLNRPVDFKRLTAGALGIPLDDSPAASSKSKLLSSSSPEDLRRLRTGLRESCSKARERAKIFNDSLSVLHKWFPSIPSKKRSRSDVMASDRPNSMFSADRPTLGTNISKMGSQGHGSVNNFELEQQKSDDRVKNVVPNKRTRTSMVDSISRTDMRANASARPSGNIEREKEIIRLPNNGIVHGEERASSIAIDSWEKSRMKKKRSGIKLDSSSGPVTPKLIDPYREPKQGQPRLVADARSRIADAHGMRPGVSSGGAGNGKTDSAQQQAGLGVRASLSRNDSDSGSLLQDRRDRVSGSEKERANLRAVNKANAREDLSAGSPTSSPKLGASARAPRSGSGAQPKLSPLVQRTAVGNDWEVSHCTSKLPAAAGGNNRKRTPSARSSSPPVQWASQRQKISRTARRTNFVPLIPSNDETSVLDSAADALVNERRLSGSSPQQGKLKSDHLSSAASESEESGAVEIKSKDKSKRSDDVDDKSANTVQKMSNLPLPPRKNKLVNGEDTGDGIRRQGRTGRGFASARSLMPLQAEKLGNVGTAKQLRTSRLGFDKNDRAGRPPTRKLTDRKAYKRQRHATINAPADFLVGSDDAHEELLAAANAVTNAAQALPNPFWKQMEPFFRFISEQDISFLKQQVDGSALTSPAMITTDGLMTNGYFLDELGREGGETRNSEFNVDDLASEGGKDFAIPLYQRLMAAIIPEEANEELSRVVYGDNTTKFYASGFEVEKDVGLDFHHHRLLKSCGTNGYSVDANGSSFDELSHSMVASDVMPFREAMIFTNCDPSQNGVLPEREMAPHVACSEDEYSSMSLNERLLLEIHCIGIYPDLVPEVAHPTDEEIRGDINVLDEKYQEQVTKKKGMLRKVLEAAAQTRQLQEKEFEQLALDKLVGMAYDKYMACWGPHAHGMKSASGKMAKQAALSFVKRTLGRCQEFDEMGKSCFSEPLYKDIFLSGISRQSEGLLVDSSTDGESGKLHVSTPGYSAEGRHSAALVAQRSPSLHSQDIYSSEALLSAADQTPCKDDTWSNRVKKRELLLEDVGAGTSPGAPSGMGSSLNNSAKGKRSERDREGKSNNREAVPRNGATKIGRPSSANMKGERKSKTKPKQKTAQLSASVNGLLGKMSEQPKSALPSTLKSSEMTASGNARDKTDYELDGLEDPIDLSGLQLPEMDVLGVPDDLGGQGQDIGSWLNIDDDGLQDHDFMGLEIPMDDLSDLNMMV